MSTSADDAFDWKALRASIDAKIKPGDEKFAEAWWRAGLVASGELSVESLAGLTPAEREHYALGPDPKDGNA